LKFVNLLRILKSKCVWYCANYFCFRWWEG